MVACVDVAKKIVEGSSSSETRENHADGIDLGGSPDTHSLASPAREAVERFTLRVLGDGTPKQFVSSGDRTVIGTHPSAQVVLDDRAVSRFHCEIAIGAQAIIRDLDSRNGTFVDGVPVYAAQLRTGAVITVGRTQLVFELEQTTVPLALASRERFGRLVGRSVAMRQVFARLEDAAGSDATVLLQGETGTGKDAAAESLHMESARRDGPFIVIDCSAIPGNLLESELFGHERGAFTGADRTRQGAFENAAGGTLFLDELGELDISLQPRLLRAIESRQIQRVGGSQRIPVDVRLIAATNRDLRAEVNARRFRSDLYYRIAVLEITMPPLRERREDLGLLVDGFVAAMGVNPDTAELLRSGTFASTLLSHPWPGNVRELRNYVERSLTLRDLLPPIGDLPTSAPEVYEALPLRLARQRAHAAFEREYLARMLARFENNVSAAARAAGVDRVHFHRLLMRNGLR
jgi:transcriptional regulator with GAF, ATPase, and Fis domain